MNEDRREEYDIGQPEENSLDEDEGEEDIIAAVADLRSSRRDGNSTGQQREEEKLQALQSAMAAIGMDIIDRTALDVELRVEKVLPELHNWMLAVWR